ncbi:MAG: SH3 domain-containing protein [Rickettsiales bacterium]|nr:SH3 domain-containing protein [Rickettsiales bacterium]
MKFLTSFLILVIFTIHNSFAEQEIKQTNYFASLRASETNVRSGPGQNYPIKFTYKLKSIPVRVINEYDNWDEIEDYEGQSGWVSQNLLTKKRMLMVRTSKAETVMYRKNSEKSRIIYNLENNVIGEYLACVEKWCEMKINNKKGWVLKADLFGVDVEKSAIPN